MEQTSEQPNCNCNKNEHNKDEGPNAKERYELLIRARNFHYENYNKWMTYFYVAISALFVSYFTILNATNIGNDKQFLEYTILILGFIVSILWYWSSKGYYYWNINFINMVGYYETDVFKWPAEERVYKVFANKDTQNKYRSPVAGANISTSKVAILFAFIIATFWGFILFLSAAEDLFSHLCNTLIYIVYTLSLPTSIASVVILSKYLPGKWLKSDIDGLLDLKINHKNPYGNNNTN